MNTITIAITGQNGLYVPSFVDILSGMSGELSSGKPLLTGPSDSIEGFERDKYSFRPVFSVDEKDVDLLYQTPTGVSYDKRYYSVKSKIKNVLDADRMRCITDKDRLYDGYVRNGGVKWVVRTRNLKDVSSILPGEVCIVKPTGGHTGAGKGNTVVDSTESLVIAKERLTSLGFTGGMVCNYITNPLLYREDGDVSPSSGYKTHFRMFLIVRPATSSTPLLIELFEYGLIRKAKLPYTNSSYENEGIHDTHAGTSGKDLYFPDDCPLPDDIIQRSSSNLTTTVEKERGVYHRRVFDLMKKAVEPIKDIVRNVARPPRESTMGFEIYGLDFIVTNSEYPRVFLLEVNTKVSYRPAENYDSFTNIITSGEYRDDDAYHGYWNDRYKIFSYEYFRWILRVGYLPLMKSRDYVVTITSRRDGKSSSKPNNKTFMITGGTGLKFDELRSILRKSGFSEAHPHMSPSYVTFNYMEKLSSDLTKFDRVASRMKCKVKSLLDSGKECITNKRNLSMNLKDKPYIARTWMSLDEVPEDMRNKPLIVKPVGDIADSGYGIRVTASNEELIEAVASTLSLISSSNGGLKSYIISEYIDDIDLIEGKKYHLRMYFLYIVRKDGFKNWFLWDLGRIVTAKEEYSKGDYSNPLIHDTHSKSTSYNLYSPRDLSSVTAERYPQMMEKMRMVVYDLVKVLSSHNVKPYPESDIGFEVFGCDFLITSDYEPVLLEVNSRVGMRNIGDRQGETYTFDMFSKEYFDWLMSSLGMSIDERFDVEPPRSYTPFELESNDLVLKYIEGVRTNTSTSWLAPYDGKFVIHTLYEFGEALKTNTSIEHIHISKPQQPQYYEVLLRNINISNISVFRASGYLGMDMDYTISKLSEWIASSPNFQELHLSNIDIGERLKGLVGSLKFLESKKVMAPYPSEYAIPTPSNRTQYFSGCGELMFINVGMNIEILEEMCIALEGNPFPLHLNQLYLSKNSFGEIGGRRLLEFLRRRPKMFERVMVYKCDIPIEIIEEMWNVPDRHYSVVNTPHYGAPE